MTDPQPEVHVRRYHVPGGAHVFQLQLPDGVVLAIVVDRYAGTRELDVFGPDEDEAQIRLRLPEEYAVTLATLLSGVNVVFDSQPETTPTGGVHVETIVLGAGSPAVGRAIGHLDVPAPDQARVLAVIRDDTPDIVEEDRDRPCQPGDRLVLVGHPAPLDHLRRYLAG